MGGPHDIGDTENSINGEYPCFEVFGQIERPLPMAKTFQDIVWGFLLVFKRFALAENSF